MPPFDVLGGTTAEDATTAARRFFQYTYQLRLLNDTAFGQDVSLAGLALTYRIDTLTNEGTTSQGRDQTYEPAGAVAAGAVAGARRRRGTSATPAP